MRPTTRLQLSILFFFQFAIWCSWAIGMGTWATGLGYSGTQIGTAYSATALAAMISPFFVGMVADRFFPAQRVLGVLHILGGVFLYAAGQTKSFGAFYPLLLLHTLCYMPTLALVNTVAFAQMQDPAKGFGGIRVLGTFGWIACSMIIGKFALTVTNTQFTMGAGISVVLGLYCLLFLPNVPPKAKGAKVNVRDVLGLDALQLMRDRSFAVLIIGVFLAMIPLTFYYNRTESYLTQSGLAEAASVMSYGQMSEVIFMLLFPVLYVWLGVKRMLLLGLSCWVVRFTCFAYGNAHAGVQMFTLPGTHFSLAFPNPDPGIWMLFIAIILHGPAFDFFLVTGQVYVDKKTPENLRGSAQGLFAFVAYGAGMFVGSLTQGFIIDKYTDPVTKVIQWRPTWIIPAIIVAFLIPIFAIFFSDSKRKTAVASDSVPIDPSPEVV